MKPNLNYLNGSHKVDADSLWKWKGIDRKKKNQGLSITGFFQDSGRKIEASVLGPGGGVGVGCGAGIGFGLIGGIGYGGWPWNHLRMVFGVGMGCGVGVGLGYGHGIGLGLTLDSFESYLSKREGKRKSDSDKRIVIQI